MLPDITTKKEVKPEVVNVKEEPTTIEAAIIDQTKEEVEAQPESAPEDIEARRITDAAIKKYWAAKEKQRMAPRVHQQDLSLHEKILREFDMSGHYGVRYPRLSAMTISCLSCKLSLWICADMTCAL
jgi:DNA polymerase delta subunit 4